MTRTRFHLARLCGAWPQNIARRFSPFHGLDQQSAQQQSNKKSRDSTEDHNGRTDRISIGQGIEDLTFKKQEQYPGRKKGIDENGQPAVVDFECPSGIFRHRFLLFPQGLHLPESTCRVSFDVMSPTSFLISFLVKETAFHDRDLSSE
ncbi:MAG: hypothetical protein QM451_05055 [Bacillota bacterium]|nr:hypothetical protein [Bacillota bacterium]HHT91299.1 hypothetical protein [Bacillota bacterium]